MRISSCIASSFIASSFIAPGFIVTAAMLGSTCASAAWRDPSPHRIQLVTVAPNVKLEVLDWGGEGRPVVLLAGLGNTGHVFDEFAPKLTDTFHVYAVTRRGFGSSSRPKEGYDVARLATDVLRVIDALKLKAPIVIGHSVAGEELSALGATQGTNIAGLVYLDAAADRTLPTPAEYTALLNSLPPAPPPRQVPDSERYASAKARMLRNGFTLPEAEFRRSYQVTPDGSEPPSPPNEPRIADAIVKAVRKPDYASIKIPALGIFAIPRSAAALFPWVDTDDPATHAVLKKLHTMNVENIKRQEALFKQGIARSKVVELLGAHHAVFLSNERDVVREIRAFATKSIGH